MKPQKYSHYLYQHNPKNSKAGEYVIGVTKFDIYYDLFFREAGADKWEAWPQPLKLSKKELTIDYKEGYVIETISKDDLFILVV